MNNKAFTLVEVLVGLFLAVVASVYAAKTITGTNKVVAAGRETFIATNLAHEGIDLTRAMRDNTWFIGKKSESWLSSSGICPDGEENNSFAIDATVVRNFIDKGDKVLGQENSALYIQTESPNLHLWTHTAQSGNKSITTAYKRVMDAECGETDVVTITSTVSWAGQGGTEKKVSIKEKLYNWWLEK
ncbi:MAG: prepilin-type N-terminal cleavage/methylation domain-containing protein [Patescibacteria group bacterium]